MRNQTTREILFLDCRLKPTPEYADRVSFRKIIEEIAELVNDNQTAWHSRDRRRKITVRDIAIEAERAWLLLYSNDGDAAGASFAHLDTDMQRDEEKQDREGRPESVHVAVSMKDGEIDSGQHLILAEVAPSLPRARIERYFNHLIRTVKSRKPDWFRQKHPDGSMEKDGTPKMLTFRNQVELHGHISNELREAIERGELLGIALETSQKSQFGVGETASLRPVKKTIRLSTEGSWKDNPWGKVQEALGAGNKANLETARLMFRAADGVGHSATLDTETGQVAGEGYIKKARIDDFPHLLKEATVQFDQSIKAKMAELIK